MSTPGQPVSTTSDELPPGFGEPDAEDLRQATFPPVMPIAISTLVLIVTGGIVVAAQYGRPPQLTLPGILLGVAAVLLLVNAVLIVRIEEFARPVFRRVLGWAVLAYAVIAGILEYVFVYDHTPGRELALFSAMLVLFALDVPLMLSYSVARWQPPDAA
jgi:hypothetical protein